MGHRMTRRGGGGGEGGFIMIKNNVTYFMNGLFVGTIKDLNRLIYSVQNMLLVHGLFP